MANTTSPHILGTAANLLGFCLFVITSLHITNNTEGKILDELTSVVAVLLTITCMLSFISIKTPKPKFEKRLESVADYFFIAALFGIFVIIMCITLNFIN